MNATPSTREEIADRLQELIVRYEFLEERHGMANPFRRVFFQVSVIIAGIFAGLVFIAAVQASFAGDLGTLVPLIFVLLTLGFILNKYWEHLPFFRNRKSDQDHATTERDLKKMRDEIAELADRLQRMSARERKG